MKYYTKKMISLPDTDLERLSELYSQNYGVYRSDSDIKPGERIRYSPRMYKRNYVKDDFYVSYAENNRGSLTGFAIYIRKRYSKTRTITWVVQLVVDKAFRGRGIASQLLQAIWGFSNDYAWGLATTNPCTIKALENATFRKVSAKKIMNHLDDLKDIFDDIPFADEKDLEIDDNTSLINSRFFVDYSSVVTPERVLALGLGDIRPGYEWFAFVFSDQKPDPELVKKGFSSFVSFSEEKLIDAYSRMTSDQGWTHGTSNEIDVFLDVYGQHSGSILDLGCGRGRHSFELAKRGFDVHGVDLSRINIDICRSHAEGKPNAPDFDVVNVVSKDNISKLKDKYDAVLALYDVVGSYPDEESNLEIIREAYKRLDDDGLFFLSVMNMELTERLILSNHRGNIEKDPSLLFELEPSRIMQTTGDVFDPRFMVLDESTGLIYRKEQFSADGELSAEYIIRDKRYRESEIRSMLESVGFVVSEIRGVRAGHFDEALSVDDRNSKELLVIARKAMLDSNRH